MAGAPKGNRNAAKRHRVMTDALRRELAQYETDTIKRGEAASVIAKNIVAKAVAGDPDAIKEIYDRLDGKPHQSVDMNITDDRPEDLTDRQLYDIATGGSTGTAEPADGAPDGTVIQ